jgi:hypothetical protein
MADGNSNPRRETLGATHRKGISTRVDSERLAAQGCRAQSPQAAHEAVANIVAGKGPYGFNAATEVYEDLEKAGVIDPTKVSRTALQNAASVASLLLTTEAMVAERPKKKAAGGVGGAGGMGGMGGMDDMDY